MYKYRSLLLYAGSLAVLILVLKVLEWNLLIVRHAFSLYAGIIALGFTALGIWLATQLYNKKKTIIIEKEIVRTVEVKAPATINKNAGEQFQLTGRELEVLECIAQGMRNAEIGERLFLSLSTIKSHTSSLYSKLDVRSRTQAIEKARQAGIIA